eukprot:TRINITY_DN81672_c0_g1_i1.p1 TRINITY_DN81672_c0_g1~~TRINITY_DN81672_c0_g1_i1.p1  ORF type:complete len:321 (+),score=-34.60 TRINITY_DN81672_c0_g1_i1:2-964(+)
MKNTQEIAGGAYKVYYGNFYKYLGVEGAVATLRSGKLKYSNPKKFNDPLDSSERQLYIESEDEFPAIDSGYIDKIVPENTLNDQKKDSLVKVLNLFKQIYNGFDVKRKENAKQFINRFIMQPAIREEIKKMKVCCFSRNYKLKKSSLMWSHYADEHYGVCLEFNIEHFKGTGKLTKNYFVPFVITYHTNLEIIRIKPEQGYHNDWLLKKLNIWAYEQEVRILRRTKEPKGFEFYEFPKSALKKVIFGYHTKLEVIKEIKDIIEQKYDIKEIKFEKMGFDNKTFKLIPLKYNIFELKHDVLIKKDQKIEDLTRTFMEWLDK